MRDEVMVTLIADCFVFLVVFLGGPILHYTVLY
jgi:hypothetical protein